MSECHYFLNVIWCGGPDIVNAFLDDDVVSKRLPGVGPLPLSLSGRSRRAGTRT